MRNFLKLIVKEPVFVISIFILISISVIVLRSISPNLFPLYFFYLISSLIVFLIFIAIDFEILTVFYWHFYVISIILLLLPLFIGQITRGAIRWIPLGPITLQTSELVRPFLLLFFSVFANREELKLSRIMKLLLLAFLPIFLILIQPSLGVAIISAIGIAAIILSSGLKIKNLLLVGFILITLIPLSWLFLQPYQRERLTTFFDPAYDPKGAGYNSIQAMISVGSGKFFGRGLGKGVQTQLAFLPEKHTDFIFAAISEELGFFGAGLIIVAIFTILWKLTTFLKSTGNKIANSFLVGVFAVILTESVIHIGMNLGIMPITGVPLPLVSAGGSALLSMMICLAMAIRASGRLR